MKNFGIIGLILSVLLSTSAMADSNQEEVYFYRTNIMENSFSHLEALKVYVNGKLEFKSHVANHVDALLDLNGMYQDIFPMGEQYPESEALPAIWSDPQGFKYAIKNNRQKIMALKQIDPADLKALKRAVNEVRMSCGDCHSYFRKR